MPYREIDDAVKIQALALVYAGHPAKEVTEITGISISQIYKLRSRAEEMGYNYQQDKKLKLEYVLDRPRSGRPRIHNKETKAKVEMLLEPKTEAQAQAEAEAGAETKAETKAEIEAGVL
jgi:transposase